VFGKVAVQPVEHAHEVRGRQLLDGQEPHVVLPDRPEATVHGDCVNVVAKASISSHTNAGKGPAFISTCSRNAGQCSRTIATASQCCVLRGT
jgi:hypothetical protein